MAGELTMETVITLKSKGNFRPVEKMPETQPHKQIKYKQKKKKNPKMNMTHSNNKSEAPFILERITTQPTGSIYYTETKRLLWLLYNGEDGEWMIQVSSLF